MTKAISKSINGQGLSMHIYLTNSSNNVVAFHNGNIDSIEEDLIEADSDDHAPEFPNH